nr:hypothetical protein [uncultured Campylobacter sp.]
MKVFCLALNPYSNGARLNFKSNLRPAALISFTRRENFKNFKECEEAVNLPLEARISNQAVGAVSSGFEVCAKAANREAVSAKRAGPTCRDAKTARTMPIDTAASKNISNFALLKHCADRKNFRIFASDEIKFATHGEPKPAMYSMVKFTTRRGLKFEPYGTTARGFTTRDKILNPKPRKTAQALKFHRGAEKK